LTTKIHQLCDGKMRPLVVLLGTGQGGDSPMFPEVMASLSVDRIGPGRARTRPDRVLADKAYSAKAHRGMLRKRNIQVVIPERSDQVANRKRRGRNGGRPVDLDKEAYKRRNVIERSFNTLKQWRGLATRYDKLALTYRGGAVLSAIIVWLHELGDTP
jgi:transposase